MPSKATQRGAELALHHAIARCEIAEVAHLLKQNVDPNCVGERSQKFPYAFTALCAAIERAAKAVSPRDAKIEADLDAAAKGLSLAVMTDLDKVSVRAYSLQIIQLLLSAGADPNRRGASRTPLSLAAGHYGDLELSVLPALILTAPDGHWMAGSYIARRCMKLPARALAMSWLYFAKEVRHDNSRPL